MFQFYFVHLTPNLSFITFKIKTMKIELINEIAEGAILLTGYEDCIVGFSEEFGAETRVVYSKDKIINKLVMEDNMSEEDALEHFYYNIAGGHYGERDPIFLTSFEDL